METKKMMLVTGCCGFIGGYVTRACLKKGWHVLGIDAETYAKEHELLFYETSAKTNTGIREMFVDIAVRIPVPEIRENPVLNYKIAEQHKSGYCC